MLTRTQRLVEWHKDHPDALLDDMRLFLQTQCGLDVSVPTISRQLRKAYGGTFLRAGRTARVRSRKQREAEGRSIAVELQQGSVGDDADSAQAAAVELYHDQRQLAPLQQMLTPRHEPLQQEDIRVSYHGPVEQPYPVSDIS